MLEKTIKICYNRNRLCKKEEEMNQILVTEKLYMTSDFKRKRRLFRIEFFLSIFLICILSSYYIYAEYDRSKSEQVSQQILSEVRAETDSTVKDANDDVMIIVLDGDEDDTNIDQGQITNTYVTSDGKEYSMEAVVSIPKIDISYPVLTETSDELLEISVNKYWGPSPNEVGNYCVVGHNYKNGKMFGRLHELKNGDVVELEDLTGRVLHYKVYNKYVVKPTDTRCTSQLTNGRTELTLITCTTYGQERLVVKCRAI